METVLTRNSEGNVGSFERVGSIAAGGLLTFAGLRMRSWTGVGLAIAGGEIARRGIMGRSNVYKSLGVTTRTGSEVVRVQRSATVNRQPDEVYRFWKNLKNFQSIAPYVRCVGIAGDWSTWRLQTPIGRDVEWRSLTTEDIPGKRIAWRSDPNAQVQLAGEVEFTHAPADRGTEVRLILEYEPLAGDAGRFFSKITGRDPDRLASETLRLVKQAIEAGEIATIEGQPSARPEDKRKAASPAPEQTTRDWNESTVLERH